MNMFLQLLGLIFHRECTREKEKSLNQTSLCIKCGKFLRSLGTWSWDSRFALYSSHLSRSIGHCPNRSICTWKDDLRLFIGETNRAVRATVFLSLTLPYLSPLPDPFSRSMWHLSNGSKFSRHSRHPTSWNWSRTGLLTCAFFVDCFLMQEVGWGQKLDFWELPALKVNIVPWMVLLGTSKLVLNFRKVPEDSDSQVEVKFGHPPHL